MVPGKLPKCAIKRCILHPMVYLSAWSCSDACKKLARISSRDASAEQQGTVYESEDEDVQPPAKSLHP